MSVSLAMIAGNEAQNLRELLPTISHLFDQIVVLANGDDETAVAAAELGAEVHRYEWCDNFADARNTAFMYATGDWIMWLDADDRISSDDIQGLERLFAVLPRIQKTAIMMGYRIWEHQPEQFKSTLQRCRMIHKSHPHRWYGIIHEGILNDESQRFYTDIFINHPPDNRRNLQRNLKIHKKAWEDGGRDPRQVFYYGQDLLMSGDCEGALEVLKHANLNTYPGVEKYWIPLYIGEAYKGMGLRFQAFQQFLMAISVCPERAEAYVECGRLFLEEGQKRKALPFFSAAMFLDKPPDLSNIREIDYSGIAIHLAQHCRTSRDIDVLGSISAPDFVAQTVAARDWR